MKKNNTLAFIEEKLEAEPGSWGQQIPVNPKRDFQVRKLRQGCPNEGREVKVQGYRGDQDLARARAQS